MRLSKETMRAKRVKILLLILSVFVSIGHELVPHLHDNDVLKGADTEFQISAEKHHKANPFSFVRHQQGSFLFDNISPLRAKIKKTDVQSQPKLIKLDEVKLEATLFANFRKQKYWVDDTPLTSFNYTYSLSRRGPPSLSL
ncbi:MAG: hypothetical protein ACEPOW_09925 [Bacteroidales bacterium]